MIAIQKETEISRYKENHFLYTTGGGITQDGTANDLLQNQHFTSYSRPMYEETRKESEPTYSPIYSTDEIVINDITPRERIVQLLNSAINLIDEVLEIYDEEIERLNTFSLCEELIKSIWKLREEANSNFVEVLVLLEVAVRNSHYRDYKKEQFKSIKMVLEKIKEVYITPQKVKECRRILMDNGIDLFAPIRNWENYKIEIKKQDGSQ